MARVHEVAHSKVIPLLVELCNGPAGPLAAIDFNSPPPPADDQKKKKGKGAKAKKKVLHILTSCLHCFAAGWDIPS